MKSDGATLNYKAEQSPHTHSYAKLGSPQGEEGWCCRMSEPRCAHAVQQDSSKSEGYQPARIAGLCTTKHEKRAIKKLGKKWGYSGP